MLAQNFCQLSIFTINFLLCLHFYLGHNKPRRSYTYQIQASPEIELASSYTAPILSIRLLSQHSFEPLKAMIFAHLLQRIPLQQPSSTPKPENLVIYQSCSSREPSYSTSVILSFIVFTRILSLLPSKPNLLFCATGCNFRTITSMSLLPCSSQIQLLGDGHSTLPLVIAAFPFFFSFFPFSVLSINPSSAQQEISSS